MADAEGFPSEEDLIEAISKVGVGDVLLNSLTAIVSLGFHRVSAESRDLPQARLAIEALRALDPVLRDHGVDEAVVRDLEQARSNLQLAYANAVEEERGTAPEEHEAGSSDGESTGEEEQEPGRG